MQFCAFMAQDLGWRWQHAALFSSMVASTDAVAVSAILHSGAGLMRAMLLQSTRRSWSFDAPNVSMASRITTLTAVVVLNTAGVGPELMAVLEGESLFNDASSITLFEVQSADASQPCCSCAGPAAVLTRVVVGRLASTP